ncbi:MAG: hypothetical protein LBO63_08150 [Oscillospiraceae bacterium]|jgi:hypothetical protein|nr:hypothetical protein [Oscillospiraceae bacterium]
MKSKLLHWLKNLLIVLAVLAAIILIGYAGLQYHFRAVATLGGGTNEFFPGIQYKGVQYDIVHFEFKEGKFIGTAKWNEKGYDSLESRMWCALYTVKDDKERNFLYYYDGDSGNTYVREGYVIPTSGEVTAVFNDGESMTQDEYAILMFQKIAALTGEKSNFYTDNLAGARREFYFAYNNCPVAAHNPGSIVFANDNFYFVAPGESKFTRVQDMVGWGKGIIITDEDIIAFLLGNPIFILPSSYEQSLPETTQTP